jgi:predicted transcriptional regulator
MLDWNQDAAKIKAEIIEVVNYYRSVTRTAKELGVSRESVSGWVAGRHLPSVAKYLVIEQHLKKARRKRNV